MVASIPREVDMYDYVIVGAGSAGCVLAARLSEDPDVNVLLLEAGRVATNENIHVPLGYLQLARTEVDWDYCSAPEPNCDYRRIPLPRGKVLGGSSSINAMVYIRGNPLDYDSWGVAGWSWSDLFPYFLKAEDNERGASRWHGVGGPLPVSENRSRNHRRGLRRRGRAGRAGSQRGLQRRGTGRRGDLSAHAARRAARERRRRLPAPRDGAAQSRCQALHARAARALRGDARGRRGGAAARRDAAAARRARGDPVRRRLQLAAASHALRGRPRRTPPDARNRGAA